MNISEEYLHALEGLALAARTMMKDMDDGDFKLSGYAKIHANEIKSRLKDMENMEVPGPAPAQIDIAQDPKYATVDGKLVNRVSGNLIPEDEPVMIFRARDVYSKIALRKYLSALFGKCGHDHIAAVRQRLKDFEVFEKNNGHRMKVPDTEIADGGTVPVNGGKIEDD